MPLRGLLSGSAMIVDERQHQLARWSAEHDDCHVRGELVEAAQQLLTAVQDDLERTPAGCADWGLVERHPDPIERMAIAGALIAAEIDRRLRRQYRELDAHQPIEHVRQAPAPASRPEPLAPDGEVRDGPLPAGTTHITAGMRIEEGPARGLDGAQLAWHYDIAAWPSGITLGWGRALSIETLRAAFGQRWDGRSVDLLLVRGSGIHQRIGGEVYGLAPQVLGVDFRLAKGVVPSSGDELRWEWQRRTDEPTIEVRLRPATTNRFPLEEELTALAHCVLTGQGEWDPDQRAEAVLADYLALHARQLAGEDVSAELAQAEAASLGDEDEDPADAEDSVDELWEAIHRFAQACGGETGDDTISGARMDAVVAVEKAVTARIAAAGNLVGGRKLFRIQDVDRPMHVVAHDWQDAIRVWRRELEECDSSADPSGVELVCNSSDLRIEGEEVDRG